ncbi:hypothetical protein CF635_003555 [Enterobacter hormaechei]|nr:hypothetical protein [Enterobacter hormaechei]
MGINVSCQNNFCYDNNSSNDTCDIVKKWASNSTVNPEESTEICEAFLEIINNIRDDEKEVHRLDLSSRGLKTLPPIVLAKELEGVIILDLSENELQGNELLKLTSISSIKQLYLNGNPLQNIPDICFESFKNLRVLELERCDLHQLPLSLLSLYNLTTLNLRGNPLTSLPGSLGYNLQGLSELDIRETHITECPHSLSILEELLLKR